MKNTLEILNKIANTVYCREENNFAYFDEDDNNSYIIERTIYELCGEELSELKTQLEIWEEIKKIAAKCNITEINDLIRYVVMQIPITTITEKLFGKGEQG